MRVIWPLQNGVICVTTDGICSTSGRLGSVDVCDNTLHQKASQQSTLLPNGNMLDGKVADVRVITAT
jgi:hypothetical protein